MFPQLNTSDKLPSNLRRSYSTRQSGSLHNAQFERPQPVFNYMDGHLDLSIHHPSTPFGNRFAPLARPEASVPRDREFYASRPHRRSRNSRGTKEAKKRRDSRRDKRRFAVQLLNEQLSRDIGETLFQYNFHSSPSTSFTPSMSAIPTTFASQHIYGNGSTQVAPSAPQLPPIAFHGFSLPDFPPLVVPRSIPAPSPVPMLAGAPTWCPPIPSLSAIGAGAGELPKFYDLSSLQKPTCSPLDEWKCKSLQLWKGDRSTISKKQSRFFPPRVTSSQIVVRLPPTAPKCLTPGAGLHDPLDGAWKACNVLGKSDSISQAIERTIVAARVVEPAYLEAQSPSAANLWNILAKAAQEPVVYASEYNLSWNDNDASARDTSAPPFDEHFGPFELPGMGIPYVHTNSLTGYPNETAAHYSQGNVLDDSAIFLAEMFASDNNAAHELNGLSQTHLPHKPVPETSVSESSSSATSANYFINVVLDTKSETTQERQDDSIAHFKSEQELFAPPPPTAELVESLSASLCDLTTFLSMGHADLCWCLACEEEPELVSEATAVESEESFTEDDGWAVWPNDSIVESGTVAVQDDSVNSARIEQQSSAPRQGTRSETLDEPSQRKPRRARALVRSESKVKFLGYYDDGAVFANTTDDEWEWNF